MAQLQPLLAGAPDEGGLAPAKQVALAGLKQHAGYAVLEELFMAACNKANKDVIGLDPAEEGYDQKVKAFQARARERNEFSLLILKSVEWHSMAVRVQQSNEDDKPQQNRITKGSPTPPRK